MKNFKDIFYFYIKNIYKSQLWKKENFEKKKSKNNYKYHIHIHNYLKMDICVSIYIYMIKKKRYIDIDTFKHTNYIGNNKIKI